jgi:hypothetical protein
MWHTRLARWIHDRREKLFWSAGVAFAVSVIFLSCEGLNSGRSIVAPPQIAGAEYVGSEKCAECHEDVTRNLHGDACPPESSSENSKNIGCESCHGPGSLHVNSGGANHTIINPRKSPETCFQCHLEVRAQFQLPHRHPVLEEK